MYFLAHIPPWLASPSASYIPLSAMSSLFSALQCFPTKAAQFQTESFEIHKLQNNSEAQTLVSFSRSTVGL